MTQPSDLEAALAASVAIYQAAQEQAAATATGITEQLPAVVGVVNANQAAVRERAAALANQQLRRLFVGLDVWDGDAVQQFTEDGAQILAVAQTATARAAAAAQDAQLAAMGVRSTTTPSDPLDVRGRVRVTTNGVDVQPRAAVVDYEGRPKVRVTVDDMSTAGVLNRPARTVRAVVASGIDPVVARERGATRLEQIVDTNLMLAQRLAEHEALSQAVDLDDRVIGYRRVIHAEKSRGGSCGLCIAAAQRIYKTNTLRAVHDRCWCSIAAVTKDFDPGKHLNTVDLKDLYKDADGNTAAALKRTRYQVDEHGELGAVLVPKKTSSNSAAVKGTSSKPPRPAASSGGGGGKPPADPPVPAAGGEFPDDADGWRKIIDHAWDRHAPDTHENGQMGTKFPAGSTREDVEVLVREILARDRVAPKTGPVDPALKARLDAGEIVLVEQRKDFVNLYAQVGDVRYEIRLAGKDSTVHPIDGAGIVRHVEKGGEVNEVQVPLGKRPVAGWNRPK